MARNVQLVRAPIEDSVHKHLHTFRIRISIGDVEGDMPKDVFVHRRHPTDPYDGTVFDEFCTVASPAHLGLYPPIDPDPERGFPFFRKDHMDVDVQSQTEFDEVWETILNAVCDLAQVLDLLDDMELQETFFCGSPFAVYTLSLLQTTNLSLSDVFLIDLFE
jgi:hypothetical protein